MSSTHPIIILGAGISGLTLAQGLLKSSIPFRIFERDPTLNTRSQGYRFRIQGPGITALRRVLTPALYSELEASCGYLAPGPIIHLDAVTAKTMEGPKGAPTQPGEESPLNADRSVMRSVLFQGLESHVDFNREFTHYSIVPSGVTVHFSDGSQVNGSLLIGADGARSRVKRQLMPDDVLLDTKGRFLFGKTTLTVEIEESYNQAALKGMSMIKDSSDSNPLTLLMEPMRFTRNNSPIQLPDDYLYWVLIGHVDRFGMDDKNLLKLSSEKTATLAETLTAHWHPSFHRLFAQQNRDQTAVLRIATSKPDLPTWESRGRVTLMGDAAHPMAPTAAAGATTAVRDAALLASVLESDGVSLESMERFEKEMRGYASEPIRRSVFGGKMMFGMQGFELEPIVFGKA